MAREEWDLIKAYVMKGGGHMKKHAELLAELTA